LAIDVDLKGAGDAPFAECEVFLGGVDADVLTIPDDGGALAAVDGVNGAAGIEAGPAGVVEGGIGVSGAVA